MDDPKPVMDYARQWPSRRSALIDDIARGIGIVLSCFAHFMLTCGICRMAMVLDQRLDGFGGSAASDIREPSIFLIIGIVSVLAAFRLICGVTRRPE
jgi:hypothetical protein